MRRKFTDYFLGVAALARHLAESLSSPFILALAFSVLATASSIIAAYCEGRLINFQYVKGGNENVLMIVPFVRNLSTLVDFIILDPFVIYFLQNSRLQRRAVDEKLGVANPLPLYHRLGLLVLAIIFGVYAMIFYVKGSQFYDATLVPGPDGHSRITVTGWIVYSWTALYIAGIFYAFIEYGAHVNRIMHLGEKDIPYAPLHPDEVGGVRFLMEPSLSFGYAMIGLLLTFVVFIIHDRILYHIESNRLLGFALYIVVATPLLGLPFYHLHRLMKRRRGEYLFDMSAAIDQGISIVKGARQQPDWNSVRDYVAAMENVDKYRKMVSAFPIWPVPMSVAFPSLGSILAASLPLVQKLMTSAFPGLSILLGH